MLTEDSAYSVSRSRDDGALGFRAVRQGLMLTAKTSPPLVTYYDYAPDPTGLSYSHEKITFDGGSCYFKNCHHEVTVRSCDSHNRYYRDGTYYNSANTAYSLFRAPKWYYALEQGGVPGHPNDASGSGLVSTQITDLDGALSRAYRNMLPRIEDIAGGTNFVNFLLELRDVKRMFEIWKGSIGVLRNLSAGVLNVEYAWRPFIRDVQSMYAGITRLQDYIDRWNKDAAGDVIYTRHADITADVWKVDQSYSTTVTDSNWVYLCQNDWDRKYTHVRSCEEEVVCKVLLAFKPNHVDVTGVNKLAAYFDVAGLGDPLSIIWEAIPFSFVVDYFLSIGRFISQFDHDFYTCPITVVDFGYSLKTIHTYTYHRTGVVKRRSTGEQRNEDAGLATFYCKVYDRRRTGIPALPQGGMPRDVDLGLLELHWPSLRQVFLMVNLANVLRR